MTFDKTNPKGCGLAPDPGKSKHENTYAGTGMRK